MLRVYNRLRTRLQTRLRGIEPEDPEVVLVERLKNALGQIAERFCVSGNALIGLFPFGPLGSFAGERGDGVEVVFEGFLAEDVFDAGVEERAHGAVLEPVELGFEYGEVVEHFLGDGVVGVEFFHEGVEKNVGVVGEHGLGVYVVLGEPVAVADGGVFVVEVVVARVDHVVERAQKPGVGMSDDGEDVVSGSGRVFPEFEMVVVGVKSSDAGPSSDHVENGSSACLRDVCKNECHLEKPNKNILLCLCKCLFLIRGSISVKKSLVDTTPTMR